MSTENQNTPFDASFAHAITPVTALTTQALCVAAVYFAASHSLKRWIAASSLQPPVPEDKSANKVNVPPRKGWARIFNKQTAKGIIPILIVLSLQVFVIFIVPKIKSQKVINTIWLTLLFICLSATFDGVIRLIIPSQTSLKLVQTENVNPTFQLKQESTRHKAWPVVSIASSVIAIASSYFGTQLAIPIMACAWTTTCLAFAAPPKINMRHVIMILNGYITLVPVLVAIVMGVVALFDSENDETSKSEDPQEVVLPSIWVFRLMISFVLAIPCSAPGIMLTLAYRYDHSKSSPIAQLSAGLGEAIVVPASAPATAKPTFFAGLSALGLSILALQVINVSTIGIPNGLESIFIFVTIPVVTLALVGSAWSRGQLRDLWMYSESWVPRVESDNFASKDDVEAAPAVETTNEKEALLQSPAA